MSKYANLIKLREAHEQQILLLKKQVDIINKLIVLEENTIHQEGLGFIINRACLAFNVTIREIRGKSRLRHLVDIRRMFAGYAKSKDLAKPKEIGKKISRDRTTVLNLIDTHKSLLNNSVYANKFETFKKAINA